MAAVVTDYMALSKALHVCLVSPNGNNCITCPV